MDSIRSFRVAQFMERYEERQNDDRPPRPRRGKWEYKTFRHFSPVIQNYPSHNIDAELDPFYAEDKEASQERLASVCSDLEMMLDSFNSGGWELVSESVHFQEEVFIYTRLGEDFAPPEDEAEKEANYRGGRWVAPGYVHFWTFRRMTLQAEFDTRLEELEFESPFEERLLHQMEPIKQIQGLLFLCLMVLVWVAFF